MAPAKSNKEEIIMHPSSSRSGSAICTGSAKVTEGCHMRIAACATHTLALLQEENTMRFATRQHRSTSSLSELHEATLSHVVLRQSEGPRHHMADNCCRDVIREYGCRTQFIIFASGPLYESGETHVSQQRNSEEVFVWPI